MLLIWCDSAPAFYFLKKLGRQKICGFSVRNLEVRPCEVGRWSHTMRRAKVYESRSSVYTRCPLIAVLVSTHLNHLLYSVRLAVAGGCCWFVVRKKYFWLASSLWLVLILCERKTLLFLLIILSGIILACFIILLRSTNAGMSSTNSVASPQRSYISTELWQLVGNSSDTSHVQLIMSSLGMDLPETASAACYNKWFCSDTILCCKELEHKSRSRIN